MEFPQHFLKETTVVEGRFHMTEGLNIAMPCTVLQINHISIFVSVNVWTFNSAC